MSLARAMKNKRDDEARLRQRSPTPVFVGGTTETFVDIANLATKAEVEAKPDALLELTDTPDSYTGQAGKAVVVKATEDGVEFATVSAGGGSGEFDYGLITDSTSSSADYGGIV